MLKEKSAWLKSAVRTSRAADQSAGAHRTGWEAVTSQVSWPIRRREEPASVRTELGWLLHTRERRLDPFIISHLVQSFCNRCWLTWFWEVFIKEMIGAGRLRKRRLVFSSKPNNIYFHTLTGLKRNAGACKIWTKIQGQQNMLRWAC